VRGWFENPAADIVISSPFAPPLRTVLSAAKELRVNLAKGSALRGGAVRDSGRRTRGVTPARRKRSWIPACAGVTRAGFRLPKPVVATKHVLRGGGGAGIQAERPSSRRLGAGPWPLIPNP